MVVYRKSLNNVKDFLIKQFDTYDFNINLCALGYTFNLYSNKLHRVIDVVITLCDDNSYCVVVS